MVFHPDSYRDYSELKLFYYSNLTKMIKNALLILLLQFIPLLVFSQEINGIVYEKDPDDSSGKKIPVPGVNIYDPSELNGTVTDTAGKFTIHGHEFPTQLVISYIGYENDTVEISAPGEYEFLLKNFTTLDGAVVEARNLSTQISMIRPYNIETMTKGELKKAACCNLSESFESNASIDAVYSDAISGLRTIQMLGLSGIYIQTLTENSALTRGLSANYGTTFVPGPWVESIQITKGVGTVVNGFESMSGQINLEFLKPQEEDPFYINLYGNVMGRAEANLHLAHRFNDKLSSMTLIHGNGNFRENDHNHDNFLDNALSKQINILHRWEYHTKKIEQVYMFRFLDDNRVGGQIGFNPDSDHTTQNLFGTGIHNRQLEFLFKNGFLFPEEKVRTMGIILTGRYHDIDSYYGLRKYSGLNKMVNGNIIFQDMINNTTHNFKTGVSFLYDDYNESFNDSLFKREEIVPGAFFEYNYTTTRFSLLLGARGDYHNLYGLKPTGRLHLRFSPDPKTTFRASAGTGFRTANIFAENSSVLASSRNVKVESPLKPEESLNSGISFTRRFFLFGNEAIFNIDYYYTYFFNQVVVDLDKNPQEVNFYNLNGLSYSHSAQADVDFALTKNLSAKLSYKFYDVRTTYHGELLPKALLSKYRFMQSMSYKTKDKHWKFDLIGNLYGPARLPKTDLNPISYQMPEYSPQYYIMHFQVTYTKKLFDFYVGAENIFNQTQHDAIINYENPFSQYFDASIIWGPLNGRNFYVGLRYAIGKKKEEK